MSRFAASFLCVAALMAQSDRGTITGTVSDPAAAVVPGANDNLNALIYQNTLMHRVEGEPLFLRDLNCHCIDPNKDFALNPRAWRDAQPGEWGTAAAFYNDYRTVRRPDEQLSFGKSFQVRERMSLQLRAEFFNAFNRTYFANPAQTRTRNAAGVPLSGFGRINPASLANTPRNGQIVARVQW